MRERADFHDEPLREEPIHQEPIRQEPTQIRRVRLEADPAAEHPLTTSDMATSTPTQSGEGIRRVDTRDIADREHQIPENQAMAPRRTEAAPLFQADEAGDFRSRWSTVQAAFVDDPRHAVEEADHLVAETIQRIAQIFADQRSELEQQWDHSGDPSTEDLRLSLQKYRSFFERLLAA
jgi:hypothetical protein